MTGTPHKRPCVSVLSLSPSATSSSSSLALRSSIFAEIFAGWGTASALTREYCYCTIDQHSVCVVRSKQRAGGDDGTERGEIAVVLTLPLCVAFNEAGAQCAGRRAQRLRAARSDQLTTTDDGEPYLITADSIYGARRIAG